MERTNEVSKSTTNLPEKNFRAGAVSLSIWNNKIEDGEGSYRTISMDRSYKDKDGNWKRVNSLRVNDLPKAAVLIQKAYEYIVLGDN